VLLIADAKGTILLFTAAINTYLNSSPFTRCIVTTRSPSKLRSSALFLFIRKAIKLFKQQSQTKVQTKIKVSQTKVQTKKQQSQTKVQTKIKVSQTIYFDKYHFE
jgi:hypothetical protein